METKYWNRRSGRKSRYVCMCANLVAELASGVPSSRSSRGTDRVRAVAGFITTGLCARLMTSRSRHDCGMAYHVMVERTEDGFVGRNDRGAEISFGTGGDDAAFTPVELLLVALGGCNIVTVEPLTAKRGHRLVRLAAVMESEKVKPNRLGPVTVTYDVVLPPDDPDAAQVFHDVAHRVHQLACTVSTALVDHTDVSVVIS